jgi:Pyridoxamine 5'-phosphate oxidase
MQAMEELEPDVIAAAECWDLLRGTSVGRVALSLRALPAILAVQYYVDGAELAICLGHHQVAPRAINETIVAFAADAIDSSSGVGWSVQAQGVARFHQRVGVPAACGSPTGGQIIHLEPVNLIGHRVRLCPFASGLTSL